MLYNILNGIFPYALACGIIGLVLMLIRKLFLVLEEVGDLLYAIGHIFLIIGIIGFVSVIPIKLAIGPVSAFITILISFIILFIIEGIFIYDLDYDDDSVMWIILLIIYLICSISFSCILYSDYKVTETTGEEMMIEDPVIREITIFNNIPLANTSYEINIIPDNGNSEDKSKDYVSYWYVTENNDVLFDKVLALDSVLKPKEDDKCYIEIRKYVTLTKKTSKHKTYEPTSKERTVNVFYLPEDIVGIYNN